MSQAITKEINDFNQPQWSSGISIPAFFINAAPPGYSLSAYIYQAAVTNDGITYLVGKASAIDPSRPRWDFGSTKELGYFVSIFNNDGSLLAESELEFQGDYAQYPHVDRNLVARSDSSAVLATRHQIIKIDPDGKISTLAESLDDIQGVNENEGVTYYATKDSIVALDDDGGVKSVIPAGGLVSEFDVRSNRIAIAANNSNGYNRGYARVIEDINGSWATTFDARVAESGTNLSFDIRFITEDSFVVVGEDVPSGNPDGFIARYSLNERGAWEQDWIERDPASYNYYRLEIDGSDNIHIVGVQNGDLYTIFNPNGQQLLLERDMDAAYAAFNDVSASKNYLSAIGETEDGWRLWSFKSPEQSPTDQEKLRFAYTLYEADGITLAEEGLSVASWGSEHDKERQYVLAIEAESLFGNAITIDDLDITLDFNNSIFETIGANDIQITSDLPLANSALINNADGFVRIAAGSADALGQTAGSGIGNKAEVVRLLVNVKDSTFVGDGLHTNNLVPLDAGIKVSANLDETVFSDLTTLRDHGGINAYATSSSPLELSRALTELTVTGNESPLILGTQRTIGTQSTTNLIRRGDVVANHQVTWENTGDAAATGVIISAGANQNSNVSVEFQANGISSIPNGSLALGDLEIQRELDGTISGREDIAIEMLYTATGSAGSVIDLSNATYTINANGGYSWQSSNHSTKNLITYQGDLNYDGRVSMKDLAYLNAGASKVQAVGLVAHDVDADFNGLIDLNDLAVLDARAY